MKKIIVVLCLVTSTSVFAQGGGILTLQGSGGSYTAPLDAQGSAKFTTVKPGNYQVSLLVPAIQRASLTTSPSASQDDKHKGWIEINSYSYGTYYTGTANGGVWKTSDGGTTNREASAPSVSEIVVTKSQDATSKKILPAVRTQLNAKTTQAGQDYYKIKLTDILISGVQPGSPAGSRPAESLSLNFEQIKFTVK